MLDFLTGPLLQILLFLYNLFGQNFGVALIVLTILIRLLLLPLTLPSLRSAQKIRELQPELEKLKKKYKKDKTALAQAQLKLYQKHGANPASGCLPQIVQIVILIALYQVFREVLSGEVGKEINTLFLHLDLTKPDRIELPFTLELFNFKIKSLPGILLIITVIAQFVSSKAMYASTQATVAKAKKTPERQDDMAAAMQTQMLYFMPLMTLFIGLSFPSGLVLYWLTFSLFMLVQQLIMKGKKKEAGNVRKKTR